jgi:tetratricopeptide (TPR) repeat protein
MYASGYLRRAWEDEFLRWFLLLVLAGSLLAIFARSAGGDSPSQEPAQLPPGIAEWAAPLHAGESSPIAEPGVADKPMAVWRALELHQGGEWDQAIGVWTMADIAPEAEVYRWIALGDCWRRTSDPSEAERALMRALALEAGNALAHYQLGLLRKEQAERAFDWPEAGEGQMWAVAFAAPAPNSRDHLQLEAMVHFERAIRNAEKLILDKPLTAPEWTTSLALHPTVRDLMLAMDVENLLGKSNEQMGVLHLARGMPDHAETFLDEAAATGLRPIAPYRDVARAYERRGEHRAAIRAWKKDLEYGPGAVLPLKRILENLRQAARRGLMARL